MLHVRIDSKGPAAERGIASLCADAGNGAVRDPAAQLGAPAAEATCADGEAAVALMVQAATLALDDTDLQITLRRS